MSIERTLSIIKPDGVSRNLIGEILSRFEKNGLRIVTTNAAFIAWGSEGFYAVHRERPFFWRACRVYMTSGPVRHFDLEGEDARFFVIVTY